MPKENGRKLTACRERHLNPRQKMQTRLTKILAVISLVLHALHFVYGEPVLVRHSAGLTHGFLLLRTLDGKTIAEGDLVQNAVGNVVTSRVTYHFKDGSLHDETSVFSQSGAFHLLKYHLIQKGPSFPRPQDLLVDTQKGEVTVSYTDDKGKQKVLHDNLDLPSDLANGIVLSLLENIRPGHAMKLSMLAATPKPLLVKLQVTPDGEESFMIGYSKRKATRYQVAIEIQGIKGWFAHLMGKHPPPTKVWVLYGTAPCFVRSEGPFCMDCPEWRIELASPTWPEASPSQK
jgi:hypothetical protein